MESLGNLLEDGGWHKFLHRGVKPKRMLTSPFSYIVSPHSSLSNPGMAVLKLFDRPPSLMCLKFTEKFKQLCEVCLLIFTISDIEIDKCLI